jgi:transglutaminase-like putative cysteine protease
MRAPLRPRLALAPALVLALAACRSEVGAGGVGFGTGVGSAGDSSGSAPDPEGLRIESQDVAVTLRDDLTCEVVQDTVTTVLNAAGLAAGQHAEVTFEPATQSVELVEAWVAGADGNRVDVRRSNVFTRPSAAAQDTPGFASGSTTTVVFPQLSVGATTHVRWRLVDRSRPAPGFSWIWRPVFSLALDSARITVTAPSGVALKCGGRDGVAVTETDDGVTRKVTATLRGWAAGRREPGMISPKDVVPLFVASTVPSWETIGAKFRETSAPSVESTPEIAAKAAEIAGDAKGVDAARAICRWVARNVNYVSVRLDVSDAWVPHRASEVLRNGYGDCKDQYALLASLLAARGIASEGVLVGRGGGPAVLPVPSPGQFDHCIAYLPDYDVYFDPTNQFCDFGELAFSLRGKFVVHATPEGRTARTPSGRADRNTYAIAHAVKLLPDGTIEGISEIAATGWLGQLMRRVLASHGSASAAADLLVQSPEGGEGTVTSTDPLDLAMPFQCHGRWRSENAVEMGPAVFLTPPTGIDYANPTRARKILADTDRRYPAVVSPADYVWVHGIELPAGYDVTHLPGGREVTSKAGFYASRWRVDSPGHVKIERHLRLECEVVQPADFPELRRLLDAYTADAREVVVLRGPATP